MYPARDVVDRPPQPGPSHALRRNSGGCNGGRCSLRHRVDVGAGLSRGSIHAGLQHIFPYRCGGCGKGERKRTKWVAGVFVEGVGTLEKEELQSSQHL